MAHRYGPVRNDVTIRGTHGGPSVSESDERRRSERDEEEALVAFFDALRPEARRTYEALAARDRRYGEDVSHEAKQS